MITIQNASYSIGAKTILDRVSFTVGDAEKIGLVGVNGVGKSTLFRLILGSLVPDSGQIIFSRSRPTIGYMPQTVSEIRFPEDLRVMDFLLSGRPLERIEAEINELTAVFQRWRRATALMTIWTSLTGYSENSSSGADTTLTKNC